MSGTGFLKSRIGSYKSTRALLLRVNWGILLPHFWPACSINSNILYEFLEVQCYSASSIITWKITCDNISLLTVSKPMKFKITTFTNHYVLLPSFIHNFNPSDSHIKYSRWNYDLYQLKYLEYVDTLDEITKRLRSKVKRTGWHSKHSGAANPKHGDLICSIWRGRRAESNIDRSDLSDHLRKHEANQGRAQGYT